MPLHAREWIKKVNNEKYFIIIIFLKLIQTNVPGGKMNRGLTVIDSFRKLVEHRELSRSEIFKAHVLGWCVEWVKLYI